ncbi:MAG: integrase arm-type DNA-binding domain-containing protein [Rhodospirillales bacterium]
MKLGKTEIDGAACPPGRRDVMLFDDELTGFALRVTDKGRKTFIFQYVRGKTPKGDPAVRRLVLGRYGDITPAQARKLAVVARGEVAAGRDPVGQRAAVLAAEAAVKAEDRRQAAAEAFTCRELLKRWTAAALGTASAAHQRDAPAAVQRCFAALMDRPAVSVQVIDAQRIVDAIARKAPVMARRARDYARAMWNWGISRNLVTHNPFAAVRIEGREVSRDRALSDPELGAVWRAASAMDYPFGPLLCLLILTLQRRMEVGAMRWAELAPDLATWTLPADRAKNRRAQIVHLAEPARAILRDLSKRPRLPGQTLVFTTTGRTPASGFTRATEKLRTLALAELPASAGQAAPWRLHDFRRTGVTTLARLGVAPHVADRLLNHVEAGKISGVAAIYQRHDFLAEREAALRLWADHVLAMAAAAAPANATPADNVVRFSGRRRRLKPAV